MSRLSPPAVAAARRLLSGFIPPALGIAVALALLAAAAPDTNALEDGPPTTPRRPGPRLGEREADRPVVMVFSRTKGFRHGSIPAGIKAMREIGKQHGFRVEATEDPTWFRPEMLSRFKAVVFLNTTGDVLDDEQQRCFESFIQGGGGYVGVHSAADTEYDWPWYGRLVGAYFKTHPSIQRATMNVEDRAFPATRFLPETWSRVDEWYVYRENPRPKVKVLLSLDESTFEGGGMNGDHPIAWYQEYDGGRAFYTGGGHTDASYSEPLFQRHLGEAVMWATGRSDPPGASEKKPTAAGGDDR